MIGMFFIVPIAEAIPRGEKDETANESHQIDVSYEKGLVQSYSPEASPNSYSLS